MLSVFSAYVVQILAFLSEKALSRHNENLQTRRSILAKLLELYNATEVLLVASEHVAREFRGYSDGTETITRTVSSKRLKDLYEKFTEFSKTISSISGILQIYDAGISILLHNTANLKFAIWKRVILDDIVLPVMVEQAGKPTFTLRFPTVLPVVGQNEFLDPELSRENLDERLSGIINRFRNSSEFVDVDLTDNEQLRSATTEIEQSIQMLCRAKEELAQFISSHFGVTQVFETTQLLRNRN